MSLRKHRVTIDVAAAAASAVNDAASLSKAELRAEELVEHALYRYIGSANFQNLEANLGYGDIGFMSEPELESYHNDVAMVESIVDNVLVVLSDTLGDSVKEIPATAEVSVRGSVATFKFMR